MIMSFCTFSYFGSSIVKSQKTGTDHFSDYFFKTEIIKAKYVKPIWKTLQNIYLQVINNVFIKIAILKILF